MITAPTVVLPFSLWAWRQLGVAEVRRDTGRTVRDAAVVIPVSLAVAHLAAGVGLRARSARSARLRPQP